MNLEGIAKGAMNNVPKAVAAGIVDMSTGMLLSIQTVDSHPQQVIDILAAATKDLFEGDQVLQIEKMFKKIRGVDNDDHYFQEILVSSTNLWHYFGRLKANPKIVLTVVCRGDVNVGMMISQSRTLAASPIK